MLCLSMKPSSTCAWQEPQVPRVQVAFHAPHTFYYYLIVIEGRLYKALPWWSWHGARTRLKKPKVNYPCVFECPTCGQCRIPAWDALAQGSRVWSGVRQRPQSCFVMCGVRTGLDHVHIQKQHSFPKHPVEFYINPANSQTRAATIPRTANPRRGATEPTRAADVSRWPPRPGSFLAQATFFRSHPS